MGWLFLHECHTKADVRNHLLNDLNRSDERAERKVLVHRTVGNHLWIAFSCVPTDPVHKPMSFVILALLAKDNGCWGYKDMDENMGPCEVDCPESVIAAAGPTEHEWALAWRAKVASYHTERKRRAAVRKGIAVGSIVECPGIRPSKFRISEITGRKLRGYCVDTGVGPYKIPRARIVSVTSPAGKD